MYSKTYSEIMKERRETREAKIKGFLVIVFCSLLILAAYFGVKSYNDRYYQLVTINGKSYSSEQHEIYIDPDEKFITVDGTHYGWSLVNSIERKEKK